MGDRESARKRLGIDKEGRTGKSSRFDAPPKEVEDEKTKSFHVQMRNNVTVKEEAAPQSYAALSTKDSSVDEWMEKTNKVNLDIDTQKFAAIVREKHGAQKEKESKEPDPIKKPVRTSDSPRAPSNKDSGDLDGRRGGDRDRRSEKKPDLRVELSLTSRRDDRDRDRRERDARGRRRSR